MQGLQFALDIGKAVMNCDGYFDFIDDNNCSRREDVVKLRKDEAGGRFPASLCRAGCFFSFDIS